MAEEISTRNFNAQEDGSTDWTNIRKNFADIEAAINEHADELKALAKHQSFTISRMFQTRGKHKLLSASRHPRCELVHAFAVVHDNINEQVNVRIVDYTQYARFNGGEKKGSGKILDLLTGGRAVHFAQDIVVELTADRRVSVYATFESTQEG